MSARDVMAKAILNAGMNMGALAHRTADTFEGKIVDFQIEALTSAGFSIVHKDEIHAPSVAELPETRGPYDAVVCKDVPADCCDYGVISLSEGREVCRVWREQDARAIAAALRELLKEVG